MKQPRNVYDKHAAWWTFSDARDEFNERTKNEEDFDESFANSLF